MTAPLRIAIAALPGAIVGNPRSAREAARHMTAALVTGTA